MSRSLPTMSGGYTIAMAKDAEGFIIEMTTIDDAKVRSTERFTLTNCN